MKLSDETRAVAQSDAGRTPATSLDQGSFALASAGLALCISAPEAVRYSALWHISDESSLGGIVVKIAFLLVCFFVARRAVSAGRTPLHRNKPILATLSMLQSVGFALLIATSAGWDPPQGVAMARSALLEASFFLFAAYASFFLNAGAKAAIESFAIGVICAGTIQVCMALVPFPVAAGCVLLLAPLSALLLVLADRRASAVEAWYSTLPESELAVFGGDRVSAALHQATASPSTTSKQHVETESRGPASMRGLYATIALLSFIVAAIHLSWSSVQDGKIVSTLVQLCAGIGTVLAGNIVLAVRRTLEDREMVEFTRLIVLPIAIGTLYVASLLSGTLVALSVIPLNIVYVAVLLLAWLTPFVYKADKPAAVASCEAFLSKRLGVVVGIGLMRDLAIGDLSWVTSVFVVVALVGLVALSVLQFLGVRRQAERLAARPTVLVSIDSEEARDLACASVAERYRLTPREREVLQLLVRGRTASYIAEELVISDTTAKTHIKHIYQKTGVQSKQTLLDIVEVALQQLTDRCAAGRETL